MADVQETLGRALQEARQMSALDSPVINFTVTILVAYVVLYFITFHLGPVLFGRRPYYPWPYVARSMHHVTRRAADFPLNRDAGILLTANVLSAIQKFNKE